MIKLYTTKSCIVCERVKRLIKSQQLDVEITEAQESDILKFREMNIRNFPVLKIDEEKHVSGEAVGEYIATNLQKLKKK